MGLNFAATLGLLKAAKCLNCSGDAITNLKYLFLSAYIYYVLLLDCFTRPFGDLPRFFGDGNDFYVR